MTENMDIGYVFKQLEEIQKQTGYLSEALDVLSHRPESDSGDPGSPGNIAEQEIARSIGDIVRARETTNQKLIEFYGMVYRDFRGLGDQPSDSGSGEKKQTRSSLADLVSVSKAFATQVSNDIAAQAGNDIAAQISDDITAQVIHDLKNA